jgi:hypothetical protein
MGIGNTNRSLSCATQSVTPFALGDSAMLAIMWRALRIGLLLLILLTAGGSALLDRFQAANWNDTLTIGIFPIDGDSRPATGAYIAGLDRRRFVALENFFESEAQRYGLTRPSPVQIRLHEPVRELPPRLAANSSAAARLWWSLKMRLYARRHGSGRAGQVRVFVIYHDPQVTASVPHSLGLAKGLIGVVYAYAAPSASGPNNIVIAHEILHTLGASDKYDLETLLPKFPEGFADPEAASRYPQSRAEIMAGRRALSPEEAEMPEQLNETLIGAATAAEIGWREPPR